MIALASKSIFDVPAKWKRIGFLMWHWCGADLKLFDVYVKEGFLEKVIDSVGWFFTPQLQLALPFYNLKSTSTFVKEWYLVVPHEMGVENLTWKQVPMILRNYYLHWEVVLPTRIGCGPYFWILPSAHRQGEQGGNNFYMILGVWRQWLEISPCQAGPKVIIGYEEMTSHTCKLIHDMIRPYL